VKQRKFRAKRFTASSRTQDLFRGDEHVTATS
jgi:hypothetical protein